MSLASADPTKLCMQIEDPVDKVHEERFCIALVAMQLVSRLTVSASLNVLVFSVNETLYQLSLSDNVYCLQRAVYSCHVPHITRLQ